MAAVVPTGCAGQFLPAGAQCKAVAVGVDPASLPPFTALRILTEWTVEPFLLTMLVVSSVLYLWGVQRLRANGVHWQRSRTVSFLVGGVGTIAFVTMSGIGAYDETLFSVHMGQHMVLSMVSPIFLALGAPVTLALRALPKSGRFRLNAVLHSRIVRFFCFPLVGFAIFVGSPFILYLTGWYGASLRNIWLHELLHAHFLAVGCVFFWPLVGVDPVPGRVSHPMRMLILVATMPLHAVLGLTIMQSRQLLASGYYQTAHPVWSDPFSEQQIAGGLLWASGDLVGLLMVVTALYQWMKASEREASREDRRLDRLEAQERVRRAREAGEEPPTAGVHTQDRATDVPGEDHSHAP